MTRKAEEQWGAGVVEQLSLDLQNAFPESKGFSTTNLWYMKKWYEFYSSESAMQKLHQLGGEIFESQITPSNGAKFPTILSFVPWRHHIEILSKCKSTDEALFYVKKCATEGWNRNTLMNCIKGHYFENLGGAITNQNPTIGLLICSNKDETEVQYAFNGISTPMGVASYDNVQVKRLQEQLPSIEELTARIRLLEEELQRKD